MIIFLKSGLSEKHTKFEKSFLMVLTNQLIYVKSMRKIFSNFVCFSESSNFNIDSLTREFNKTGPVILIQIYSTSKM